MRKPVRSVVRRQLRDVAGFSLVELLVSTTIMLVVLGATMAAMASAVRANQAATMTTSMNSNLRTGMDIMVRDLLQTGQDLPVGRVVSIPSGTGSVQIKLPGAPTTAFVVPAGTTQLSAVLPGPGLGPTINNVPTDMITFLAADSSFSNVDLVGGGLTNTSMTVPLPTPTGCELLTPSTCTNNGRDISTGGPDDILPGQLIMFTKGSLSTLVEVTTVNGSQTVNFAATDSLLLNQTAGTAGTLTVLNAAVPPVATSLALALDQTNASRIRMISYYIDARVAGRPRLVRRMGNGHPTSFDNDTLGTVVAFDIENLQISYDIANGGTNPANIKMTAADRLTTGPCTPSACSPNQIRKVNLILSGRSSLPLTQSHLFLRNALSTGVSLRSLSFVDKYTNAP